MPAAGERRRRRGQQGYVAQVRRGVDEARRRGRNIDVARTAEIACWAARAGDGRVYAPARRGRSVSVRFPVPSPRFQDPKRPRRPADPSGRATCATVRLSKLYVPVPYESRARRGPRQCKPAKLCRSTVFRKLPARVLQPARPLAPHLPASPPREPAASPPVSFPSRHAPKAQAFSVAADDGPILASLRLIRE
jgi:hypothetical protein